MTMDELADKFERVGYGNEDITKDDLKLLGLEWQKTYQSLSGRKLILNNWEYFCVYIYEKVSKKEHPGCKLRGAGFRSQAYGKDVAKAIRDKYVNTDHSANCMCSFCMTPA